MSPLGMIRHLARVEHSWTRRIFEGQSELPRLYRTEEDPDLDFNQAVADDEVAPRRGTPGAMRSHMPGLSTPT